MTYVNLQNTPTLVGTVQKLVEFQSGNATLKGILFLPTDAKQPLPAVIVTGAWTTVKEQMAGTYARALAVRGYAALAFDFTGWGESTGAPRYVENPTVKTADIHAAVEYLAGFDTIDSAAISGLGICASSGYMASAVADNTKLQKLALVAPWLHDPQMAEGIYGGAEVAANLLAASETDTTLVAASASDQSSVMYQAPYYTEEHRGLIAAYDNKFSTLSWKHWLQYDAQSSADRLQKPTLLVGSPSIALLAGAEAYEARTSAPVQKIWLGEDVTQFDFYDRGDAVEASVNAVADFLA